MKRLLRELREALLGLSVMVYVVGCSSGTKPSAEADNVLARVHNQSLYQAEVSAAYHSMGLNRDSAEFVEEYVKEWMTRRLILFYAPQYIEWDEKLVRKQLDSYRYTLLLNALHAQYISDRIQVPIEASEVEKYYESKPENYVLSYSILRMVGIRVGERSAQLSGARRCIRRGLRAEQREWDALLSDSTLRCRWDSERWYAVQEALAWLPSGGFDMRLRHQLERPQYFEVQHQGYYYLVRVLEVREAGERAPLAYAEDEIRRIILSKRRDAAMQLLKEKIWNEAKRDNAVDSYL